MNVKCVCSALSSLDRRTSTLHGSAVAVHYGNLLAQNIPGLYMTQQVAQPHSGCVFK